MEEGEDRASVGPAEEPKEPKEPHPQGRARRDLLSTSRAKNCISDPQQQKGNYCGAPGGRSHVDSPVPLFHQ